MRFTQISNRDDSDGGDSKRLSVANILDFIKVYHDRKNTDQRSEQDFIGVMTTPVAVISRLSAPVITVRAPRRWSE